MKSIRLNIRALAFDGKSPLPSGGRITANSQTGSYEVVGQSGGRLAKFGLLRMRDLVAHGLIAATESAHVSWAGHSGQAGVTSFVVRSCHVAFGRQIDTSPTRTINPSGVTGQVGPFVLGPTDELVLTSNAGGEQLVTIELLVGTVLEVERLIDRHQGAEPGHAVALHAGAHRSGGSDELDVTGLSGLLADAQNPLSHAGSHASGGPDPIKLDDLAAPDDNTDLDATASAHGLLPRLSGNAGEYLSGGGSWSVPSTETLAATLVAGNKTDGTDIEVSTSDAIVGEDGGSISFAATSGLVTVTDASISKLYVAGAESGDAYPSGPELTIGSGAPINNGMTVFTGSVNNGGIYFTDTAGAYQGAVRYTHYNDQLNLDAGGSTRAFVASTGLHPNADNTYDFGLTGTRWRDGYFSRTLYVAGAQSGDALASADELIIGDGAAAYGLTVFTSTSSIGSIQFTDGASGAAPGQVGYSHGLDQLLFTASGTTRVFVDSAGLHPNSHNLYDLGLTGTRWRDGYFAGTGYFATRVVVPLVVGGDFGTGTGAGTAITVRGGEGGTTGGVGGTITVRGGNAQAGNTAGGTTTITGGSGSGSGAGGALTVQGGSGGPSSGAGANVTLRGGSGGSGNGNGGNATVSSGSPTGTGNPGNVFVSAAAAVSGNVQGGQITVTAGTGSGTGTGGGVLVYGGTGGTGSADGGSVQLKGGGGGTTSGTGGDVYLAGGSPGGGNSGGGNVSLSAGPGAGSGNGGQVTISGGAAAAASGSDGGLITISGGAAAAVSGSHGGRITISGGDSGGVGTSVGGEITLNGGDGSGAGVAFAGAINLNAGDGIGGNCYGAAINLNAGDGNGSSDGGAIKLTGGTGGSTSGWGGAITVTAGPAGSNTGTGGSVNITTGNGGGTVGSAGNVVFTSGTVTSGSKGVVRIADMPLEIAESSSVPGPTIGAGYGRFWVGNETPCRPKFQNDANQTVDFGRMPILTFGVGNSISTSVIASPYTTTAGGHPVIEFVEGVSTSVHWYDTMPWTYLGGSVTLRMLWTGTISDDTKYVFWRLRVERLVAGVVLNSDGSVFLNQILAGPAVEDTVLETNVTLTSANLDGIAAGEAFRLYLTRLGNSSTSDTYTGSAQLVCLQMFQ